MTWNNALDRLHSAVLSTFGEQDAAAGGPGRPTVNGVAFDATFSRRYVEVPAGEAVQAGHFPLLECREADAAAVGLGYDVMVIVRGQPYRVVAVQPDGDGWAVFVLEEA